MSKKGRGSNRIIREICMSRRHWLTPDNVVWQKKILKGGVVKWYRSCKICKQERSRMYMKFYYSKKPFPDWKITAEASYMSLRPRARAVHKWVREEFTVGPWPFQDPMEIVGGLPLSVRPIKRRQLYGSNIKEELR